MKRIIYSLAVICTLVIGAVFSARNAGMVELDFMLTTIKVNLSLAIIIALIVGVVLGILASLIWIVSSKREVQRLRKQADITSKELNNLRAIPIRDQH